MVLIYTKILAPRKSVRLRSEHPHSGLQMPWADLLQRKYQQHHHAITPFIENQTITFVRLQPAGKETD